MHISQTVALYKLSVLTELFHRFCKNTGHLRTKYSQHTSPSGVTFDHMQKIRYYNHVYS